MDFNPMRFIETLKYMGIGMLGIFIIIGIIIASTYIRSGVSEKLANKNKQKDE